MSNPTPEYQLKKHVDAGQLHAVSPADTFSRARAGNQEPRADFRARMRLRAFIHATVNEEGFNVAVAEKIFDRAEALGIKGLEFNDGMGRRDGRPCFTLHGRRIGPRFAADMDDEVKRVIIQADQTRDGRQAASPTVDKRAQKETDRQVYAARFEGIPADQLDAEINRRITTLYGDRAPALLANSDQYKYLQAKWTQDAEAKAQAEAKLATRAVTPLVVKDAVTPKPTGMDLVYASLNAYGEDQARRAEKMRAKRNQTTI